jgi:alkylated DNA nucleotide flippase Atl1
MTSLSEEEMILVPWQRVIGTGGAIPALKYGFRGEEQIRRLEKEGFSWNKNRLIIKENQWFKFS